ncbi:MAG TPA: pyridoxal phosphate-dependent aminotransferase [Phycisphaerae bacterium]|jgi:aspartate aminotransferase|nr:pyridoxal phosphate-dependent aminotransferase [Phycisphaerae bacterium]HPC20946.1 pyridoxal phosphate-dependent aminotransferase [Phycisphaerae bacterium]HRS27058.1 pyridoxal phosphate-dependent aminotransferase [Phycisphaerae bacterium]
MPSVIADKVAADMGSASFIREMFEKGRRLKAEFGEDNVFDFSLGNPNATPPDAFFRALREAAEEHQPALHRYMPNVGFDEARAAVARFLRTEYGAPFEAADVIMTSGAAGGMNVTLRALCNPGDEVLILTPFFPEYRFYVEQAGGRVVLVPTDADFQPDLGKIEAAITERTRAIIINSPNNPTGAIYTEAKCQGLGALLARHDRPDRPIYILLDDPYRRIVYDVDTCPTPLRHYPRTILISSYSKDISIAGERIGYIAVPHSVPQREKVLAAMTMLNRTLGFVNASAFMQRVIARCADARCDLDFYRQNRDLLCNALLSYGYDLKVPGGALYAFPKTPIADDAEFIAVLVKHRVLAVPGRGFGRPGYMRLSFCVDRKTIERGLPALKAAIDEVR